MRTTPLLLLLSACGYGYGDLGTYLWDPDRAVAADDGLYVPLPQAGGILRLQPGADPAEVELDGWRAISLQPVPDGTAVLARMERWLCEDPEVKPGASVEECPTAETVRELQLARLADGAVTDAWEIRPELGAFQLSPDNRFALSLVDPDLHGQGGGLVNLTAMRVIDLGSGDDWEVAIGFDAVRVEFLQDEAGATTGAVVLSRNEVAVVDLMVASPEPDVIFPLSLDPDVVVQPRDVLITPDGEHALLSIQGSADLYVLDLANHSINILALRGVPSAMAMDAGSDRTFVVYAGQPYIDAIDHDRFGVTSWETETGFDHVELNDGVVLACVAPRGEEVWRLDPETDLLTEYQLNYSVGQLRVAPDGSFAMTTPTDGSRAFELLDLLPDGEGRIDDRSRPYGLDGAVADVAFTADGDGTSVLILQQYQQDVYRLHWPDLHAEVIELSAPPRDIGALPGGGFYITHADALGRVSFLAADGTLTEVTGFATFGLFHEPLIAGEEE